MSGPSLYRLPVARGNTAAGIYLGAVGAVAGIVLVSIWATTQLTAYRLHFHPALGSPLLTVRSPYRELLGPAAVLVATLGIGGLVMPTWRSTAAMLFVLAAALLALRVGPLYAPLNFFVWWWRFGDVPATAEIWSALCDSCPGADLVPFRHAAALYPRDGEASRGHSQDPAPPQGDSHAPL